MQICRAIATARSMSWSCGATLVHEADPVRLGGVKWLVGQEDFHGVAVAKLIREQRRTWSTAQPTLAQECELETRVLGAGDTNVGRGEQ